MNWWEQSRKTPYYFNTVRRWPKSWPANKKLQSKVLRESK